MVDVVTPELLVEMVKKDNVVKMVQPEEEVAAVLRDRREIAEMMVIQDQPDPGAQPDLMDLADYPELPVTKEIPVTMQNVLLLSDYITLDF